MPLIDLNADEDAAPVWYPEAEGFYKVTVVDAAGLRSSVNVRVRALNTAKQP